MPIACAPAALRERIRRVARDRYPSRDGQARGSAENNKETDRNPSGWRAPGLVIGDSKASHEEIESARRGCPSPGVR
jgi:hypothetical protein